MKVLHEGCQGVIPLLDTNRLPDNAAQSAQNFDLRRGNLRPFKDSSIDTTYTSAVNSIYKYFNGSAYSWLTWTETDIDVVKSPVNGDTYHRIFYTGKSDGKLHQYGTFGDRAMGMPSPSAPSIATADGMTFSSFVASLVLVVDGVNTPVAGTYVSCEEMVEDGVSFYRMTFSISAGSGTYSSTFDHFYKVNVPNIGDLTDDDKNVTNAYSFSSHHFADIRLLDLSSDIVVTKHISPNTYDYTSGTITVDFNIQWMYSADTRTYILTFVNNLGQEGPPSSNSSYLVTKGGHYVNVSGLTVSSDSNITKKRLYRVAAASNPVYSEYKLVAELTNATTSYSDLVKTSDLGMQFEYRTNPPDDLKGLVYHPARFLAAFKGRTVYMTQPYLPHSWPHKVEVDADIVGLAVSGNDIIVLTNSQPIILSGTNPASMRESKVLWQQSCVSKRGICKVGDIVVYPSPDGLCMFKGPQPSMLTGKVFHRIDWQSYTPSSTIAESHDDMVFVWMTGINFIIDLSANVMPITVEARSAFNDTVNDTLYYLSSDGLNIMEWEGASSNLVGKWRGKDFDLKVPVGFTKCQVIADSYPSGSDSVKLHVYFDGVLYKTMIISSERVYNLPFRRRDEVVSIEVESSVIVDNFSIAQSIGDYLGK